ncbi:hypothetical protein BDN72DRAFT_678000 [Pluteus cervinus]|uniref:Uncharacterized protein n=1 Tax=Pluteus cervinus TaxID=181527 RepID=A0ACD2ZZH4_9AGAR|nr:hypothetical protein BDN72DRAFT_678000 [Pluteus cervinus]
MSLHFVSWFCARYTPLNRFLFLVLSHSRVYSLELENLVSFRPSFRFSASFSILTISSPLLRSCSVYMARQISTLWEAALRCIDADNLVPFKFQVLHGHRDTAFTHWGQVMRKLTANTRPFG